MKRAQHCWLRQEINYAHYTLSEIDKKLYRLNSYLTTNINEETFLIFRDFVNYIDDDNRALMIRIRNNHKLKLDKLIGDRPNKAEVGVINDFVVNKSSIEFSTEEELLLNMSLNFALPPSRIPIDNVVADLEIAIATCTEDDEVGQAIRNGCEKVIKNYDFGLNNKQYKNPVFIRALKSLQTKKRENNIIITRADKGNKTVILDHDEYVRSVENMLNNNQTFVPVAKPEPRLNAWMRLARSTVRGCTNIMSTYRQNSLRQSNYQFPRLYALPKIHKQGDLKFRPISSDIQSPNYLIAKWLCSEFKKFPQPRGFSVKNSYDFINGVKNHKFKPNEIMASLDIESMYTNISVREASRAILFWLRSINIDREKIDEYMRLVDLCLGTCYFQFNKKVYQQVDSLAMGNPLSAFAANCFMSEFETNAKSICPDFPSIWFRYVDDTFVIIDRDRIDDFLIHLNSLNNRINFTCELENNGVLPFLDLKLTRINDSIDFNIYRKETTTDRCIPSNSYHSKRTKFAALNSFCYRAVNVPLSGENYEAEVNKIYQIADTNGYERKIVDS